MQCRTYADLQKAVHAVTKTSRDRPYEYTPLPKVAPAVRPRTRRQHKLLAGSEPKEVTPETQLATEEDAESDSERNLTQNDVSDLPSRVRIYAHIGEGGTRLFQADSVIATDEDVGAVCRCLETRVGSEMTENQRFSILLSRAPELSWSSWSRLTQSALTFQRRGGGARVCMEALALPSVSVLERLTFGVGFDPFEVNYLAEQAPVSEDASHCFLLKGDLTYLALLCYRIERRHSKSVRCPTLASMLWLWLAGEIDRGSCPCLQCGLNAITIAFGDLIHRGIFKASACANRTRKYCERLQPIGRATQEHLNAFAVMAKVETSAWTTPI